MKNVTAEMGFSESLLLYSWSKLHIIISCSLSNIFILQLLTGLVPAP